MNFLNVATAINPLPRSIMVAGSGTGAGAVCPSFPGCPSPKGGMGLPDTGRYPFGVMSGGFGSTTGEFFFFLRVATFVVLVVPGCEGMFRAMAGKLKEAGVMENPFESMMDASALDEAGEYPIR